MQLESQIGINGISKLTAYPLFETSKPYVPQIEKQNGPNGVPFDSLSIFYNTVWKPKLGFQKH